VSESKIIWFQVFNAGIACLTLAISVASYGASGSGSQGISGPPGERGEGGPRG
jgi:hypothetical protein